MTAPVTGLQLRKSIARASYGDDVPYVVQWRLPHRVGPRLFDKWIGRDEISGVYVIYAPRRPRNIEIGASRILYIGRGDVYTRLGDKKAEKPALWRLSDRMPLKFIAFDVANTALEFVLEGILLNEHENMFGRLPKYNRARGSSSLLGWRRVVRASPGPVAILSHYGR